jgi:hypothetical protein
MLWEMRSRAGTVYPFCRARSWMTWTWSGPDAGGWTGGVRRAEVDPDGGVN